ncbi:CsiV family protein [Thioalkalivibrio sp.]|uniref:CsiV family protein n=1 Tax=Thioalkalivibrio sp. TaxID=2093813 RepID=UPI0039751BA7
MPRLSRRRFLTRMATLPLLATLPAPSFSQVGRQYRIELVIFEHLGPESRAFIDGVARPMEANLSGFGIGEGPIRPSRDGFELARVADRVERSGQARVLARLAWDQTGRDYQSASWMRIQEGRYLGPRNPGEAQEEGATVGLRPLAPQQERYELEGRLRVWVGRFLHLETDLVYYPPDAIGSEPDIPHGVPVRGSQRMNSGDELFYLDNPVIGMIARVTRIDE